MSNHSAAEDRSGSSVASRGSLAATPAAVAAAPSVMPLAAAPAVAQRVAAAAAAVSEAAAARPTAAPAAFPVAAVAPASAAAVPDAAAGRVAAAPAGAAATPQPAAGMRPTGPGTADAPAARIFRDDPRLDRRIIEGMLRDRDTFIAKMGREGYTEGAVLRRAAELGLSEALIRQVKSVAADLAGERPGRRGAPASLGARTCLSCDRIFLSSGPGNRLCMRCRGGDAGLAQL